MIFQRWFPMWSRSNFSNEFQNRKLYVNEIDANIKLVSINIDCEHFIAFYLWGNVEAFNYFNRCGLAACIRVYTLYRKCITKWKTLFNQLQVKTKQNKKRSRNSTSYTQRNQSACTLFRVNDAACNICD